MEPQLYAAESVRLKQKSPGDLDAWDCVIRALSHRWRGTQRDSAAALDLLAAALQRDPAYSRALGLHAWLSLWRAHALSTGGLSAILSPATEQARAAVALDRDDPWAHLALGFVHMFRREHRDAVEELGAALDLNPNFALGHACLGLTLSYGGKGPEAVAHVENAMRLGPRDPFFPILAGNLGFAHFMAGDYAAGLQLGRRAVRQGPELAGHWRVLALSAAMLGHREEARDALLTARKLHPEYSVAWVESYSPLVQAADRARYCDILRASPSRFLTKAEGTLQPAGDRQVFGLNCATAVSSGEVRVLMATLPDGSLQRYFNEQDTTETPYQRGSRGGGQRRPRRVASRGSRLAHGDPVPRCILQRSARPTAETNWSGGGARLMSDLTSSSRSNNTH